MSVNVSDIVPQNRMNIEINSMQASDIFLLKGIKQLSTDIQ